MSNPLKQIANEVETERTTLTKTSILRLAPRVQETNKHYYLIYIIAFLFVCIKIYEC